MQMQLLYERKGNICQKKLLKTFLLNATRKLLGFGDKSNKLCLFPRHSQCHTDVVTEPFKICNVFILATIQWGKKIIFLISYWMEVQRNTIIYTKSRETLCLKKIQRTVWLLSHLPSLTKKITLLFPVRLIECKHRQRALHREHTNETEGFNFLEILPKASLRFLGPFAISGIAH